MVPTRRPCEAAARRLDEFDWPSSSARTRREKALAVITAAALARQGVPHAMGETSEAAARRFRRERILAPAGGRFDSEALLELPELPGRGAVAAGGWRSFAATAGASCSARRWRRAARGGIRIPATGAAAGRRPGPLRTALAQGAVDALTVTSSEGLDNLVAMVGAAMRRRSRRCSAVRRPPAHRRGGAGHGLRRDGRRDRRRATRPAGRAWKRISRGGETDDRSWNRTP
jgi:hypothetical protein